jgi:hypothetical protein
MRLFGSICVIATVLVLMSCEGRAPLNHGEVVAIANHYQINQGVAWGEPNQVLPPPPDGVDSDGHSWWQVRYPDGADGQRHVILVDSISGWARVPWPNYAMRQPAIGKPSVASPVTINDGHFVLALTPIEPANHDRRTALETEMSRLNVLADQNGLAPLFFVRTTQNGAMSLVYGWQGDRGIAKDDRIVQWMKLRTAYQAAVWLDLSQP